MTHIIEEEAGSFGPRRHPHNGYYAGDFTTAPFTSPDAARVPTSRPSGAMAGW